jgi:Putative Actinobacterial Holin-X, holin superfamily III
VSERESDQKLGRAAKLVAEKASTIARLELELASLELKKKAADLGLGLGLAIGAAAVAFYAIGFLFATIAAGLAEAMPVWLSLLIVTVVLLIVTGILALFAVRALERGRSPVPRQAIEEAKLTREALKSRSDGGS